MQKNRNRFSNLSWTLNLRILKVKLKLYTPEENYIKFFLEVRSIILPGIILKNLQKSIDRKGFFCKLDKKLLLKRYA